MQGKSTDAVRERPILFSGPMIRAILAGSKTQTRRIVKPQPELIPDGIWKDERSYETRWWSSHQARAMIGINLMGSFSPYGSTRERLWVRETWKPTGLCCGYANMNTKACSRFAYAADPEQLGRDKLTKWRPSIFMPRWASASRSKSRACESSGCRTSAKRMRRRKDANRFLTQCPQYCKPTITDADIRHFGIRSTAKVRGKKISGCGVCRLNASTKSETTFTIGAIMQSSLTNYKTVSLRESFGHENIGVKILVAVDRDLTQAESFAIGIAVDEIMKRTLTVSRQNDIEDIRTGREQTEKLVACFDKSSTYIEQIPNGYCSDYCCVNRPWLIVTTPKGRIKIGWRKRVIVIDWTDSKIEACAEAIFPGEDVTRDGRMIHAWGYEKATQYIAMLMM